MAKGKNNRKATHVRVLRRKNGKDVEAWMKKGAYAAAKKKGKAPRKAPKPKVGSAGKKKGKKRQKSIYEQVEGVNGKGINSAVNSTIASANAPLKAQMREQQAQYGFNLEQSDKWNGQTQQELDALKANTQAGTQGMLALAAKQHMSQQNQSAESGTFLRNAFGGAWDNAVGEAIQRDVDQTDTTQNAANVGNAWDVGLGGSLQQDFFDRAKATGVVGHQEFNLGQRKDLTDANRKVMASIDQNRASRAALQRQYLQEDAQFGFTLQQQRMEGEAAKAAGLLDAARYEQGRKDAKNERNDAKQEKLDDRSYAESQDRKAMIDRTVANWKARGKGKKTLQALTKMFIAEAQLSRVDAIKEAVKRSPGAFKKAGFEGFRNMLVSIGLKGSARNKLIREYYPAYSKETANAVEHVYDLFKNPFGSMPSGTGNSSYSVGRDSLSDAQKQDIWLANGGLGGTGI